VPERADYVFVRPNGKPYRPRVTTLRARAWENLDGDQAQGVIVFGTLNPSEARQLAYDSCNYWYGDADSYGLADAAPGWWRDTFTYAGRAWVEDGDRGVPGVMFTWAEMDISTMDWCGFCLIPVQTGQKVSHWPSCPTLDPTADEGE
jgi:hypothetical protein